jgi:hypothetical protein
VVGSRGILTDVPPNVKTAEPFSSAVLPAAWCEHHSLAGQTIYIGS